MMEKNKTLTLKIASEMMHYFIEHKIMQIQMTFDFSHTHFFVEVTGKTATEPDDLEKITQALTDGRQPELEAYYFDLLGDDLSEPNYYLIGAMLDKAQVKYENQQLTIQVWRGACEKEV